ncbi:hypothetical protein ANMWB30_23510 [Arthrobacter sp. MWB30]|nr:hypothetical protein ANMWB30_23510 [Arthrobacter sp. MWB30]
MPTNRHARILEVERLAATGMTQRTIAAHVGVHPRTVADDLAVLRHQRAGEESSSAFDGAVTVRPTRQPAPRKTLEVPINQPSSDRTWTTPLPCEAAWASTPKQSGLYKWFLSGEWPPEFMWPPHLTPIVQGDLIYVGKASKLRTRAKHHKAGTATSTLRRTLASLMGFPGIWRGSSAHPGIGEEHNAYLTEWMTSNLLMSFSILESGEVLKNVEEDLRKSCKAPLNKDGLTAEQRHASAIGIAWKADAVR